MNYFNDSESGHSREKIGLKHIAFLIALFLVLLLPAGWMFYSAHQEQIKQEELRKTREEWRKAIATLMQDYPRKNEVKKEKKMAVKIARGTTGQADPNGYTCVFSSNTGWTIEPSHLMGPILGSSSSPNGWDMTSEGVITVPPEAEIGTYEGKYYTGLPGECPEGNEVLRYVFTVPCVKIELTATRVR